MCRNLSIDTPFSLVVTPSDEHITLLSFKILMLLIVLLLGGTDLTLTATEFGKPESDNGEVSEPSEAPLPSRDTLAGLILAFKPL